MCPSPTHRPGRSRVGPRPSEDTKRSGVPAATLVGPVAPRLHNWAKQPAARPAAYWPSWSSDTPTPSISSPRRCDPAPEDPHEPRGEPEFLRTPDDRDAMPNLAQSSDTRLRDPGVSETCRVSHAAVLAIASTLSVKPSAAPAPNDGYASDGAVSAGLGSSMPLTVGRGIGARQNVPASPAQRTQQPAQAQRSRSTSAGLRASDRPPRPRPAPSVPRTVRNVASRTGTSRQPGTLRSTQHPMTRRRQPLCVSGTLPGGVPRRWPRPSPIRRWGWSPCWSPATSATHRNCRLPGAPPGIRTQNQWIKSPLLCR